MADIICLCPIVGELTLELVTTKLVPAIIISKHVIKELKLWGEWM